MQSQASELYVPRQASPQAVGAVSDRASHRLLPSLTTEPGLLVCALFVLGVLVVAGVMAVMTALVTAP